MVVQAFRANRWWWYDEPVEDNEFNAKAYRPTTLLSRLRKTLEKVVNQIEKKKAYKKLWLGFTKGKRTDDALYQLVYAIEKYKQNTRQLPP